MDFSVEAVSLLERVSEMNPIYYSDEGVAFCKFCGGCDWDEDGECCTERIRHKKGCLWVEIREFCGDTAYVPIPVGRGRLRRRLSEYAYEEKLRSIIQTRKGGL